MALSLTFYKRLSAALTSIPLFLHIFGLTMIYKTSRSSGGKRQDTTTFYSLISLSICEIIHLLLIVITNFITFESKLWLYLSSYQTGNKYGSVVIHFCFHDVRKVSSHLPWIKVSFLLEFYINKASINWNIYHIRCSISALLYIRSKDGYLLYLCIYFSFSRSLIFNPFFRLLKLYSLESEEIKILLELWSVNSIKCFSSKQNTKSLIEQSAIRVQFLFVFHNIKHSYCFTGYGSGRQSSGAILQIFDIFSRGQCKHGCLDLH